MDRENLENLDEESLFQIQNTISEIIKERNFKKGDIEAIVDDSFNIAFPKIDGLGLNPWVEGSMCLSWSKNRQVTDKTYLQVCCCW